MDRLSFNTAVAFRSINDVYSVEVKLTTEVASIHSKIKSLYLPKNWVNLPVIQMTQSFLL